MRPCTLPAPNTCSLIPRPGNEATTYVALFPGPPSAWEQGYNTCSVVPRPHPAWNEAKTHTQYNSHTHTVQLTHTHTHTYTYCRIQTCTVYTSHTQPHTCPHTYTHTHMLTHTLTQTHTHTHSCSHTHTHTHAHTHTHTQGCPSWNWFYPFPQTSRTLGSSEMTLTVAQNRSSFWSS